MSEVYLQKRKVGLLVRANHRRRQRLPIVGYDLNLGSVVDNMVVGNDVAVRGDEEA